MPSCRHDNIVEVGFSLRVGEQRVRLSVAFHYIVEPGNVAGFLPLSTSRRLFSLTLRIVGGLIAAQGCGTGIGDAGEDESLY